MYDIVKNVIVTGDYRLEEILVKIDALWVSGRLTDAEHTELIGMARDRATPENSYAGLQEQIDGLYGRMSNMEQAITDLVARITVLEGGTVTPSEPVEYPDFVQPTGAHDAYQAGDKITFAGKQYICQMDGCVWSPEVYPAAWCEEIAVIEGENA